MMKRNSSWGGGGGGKGKRAKQLRRGSCPTLVGRVTLLGGSTFSHTITLAHLLRQEGSNFFQYVTYLAVTRDTGERTNQGTFIKSVIS